MQIGTKSGKLKFHGTLLLALKQIIEQAQLDSQPVPKRCICDSAEKPSFSQIQQHMNICREFNSVYCIVKRYPGERTFDDACC